MKIFQRQIENFTCRHCKARVKGTGYTNHCPHCLWSRHVDVNPGDRQEACGRLMPPISYEMEKGEYILIHECQKCGAIKRNRFAKNDNINSLLKLSETVAKKLFF